MTIDAIRPAKINTPINKPLTRYERFKARIKNITLVQAAGLALAAIAIGGLSYISYNYAGCVISPAGCVLGL